MSDIQNRQKLPNDVVKNIDSFLPYANENPLYSKANTYSNIRSFVIENAKQEAEYKKLIEKNPANAFMVLTKNLEAELSALETTFDNFIITKGAVNIESINGELYIATNELNYCRNDAEKSARLSAHITNLESRKKDALEELSSAIQPIEPIALRTSTLANMLNLCKEKLNIKILKTISTDDKHIREKINITIHRLSRSFDNLSQKSAQLHRKFGHNFFGTQYGDIKVLGDRIGNTLTLITNTVRGLQEYYSAWNEVNLKAETTSGHRLIPK